MTTTAPQTDRAATEALARELTDDDWSDMDQLTGPDAEPGDTYAFDHGRSFDVATARALLAYLDEVWAGLTAAQRRMLTLCVNGHPGLATTLRECWPVGASQYRCAGRLVALHLAVGSVERGFYKATPLGRAVLRRAKEQGR